MAYDGDDGYGNFPWWMMSPRLIPRMFPPPSARVAMPPPPLPPPWERPPPPFRLWDATDRDTIFEDHLVKDEQTVCVPFLCGVVGEGVRYEF